MNKPLTIYHDNCADGAEGHRNAAGFKSTMDKFRFVGDTMFVSLVPLA